MDLQVREGTWRLLLKQSRRAKARVKEQRWNSLTLAEKRSRLSASSSTANWSLYPKEVFEAQKEHRSAECRTKSEAVENYINKITKEREVI
jgi:hypothetical protein